jgi:hypothetical protein
VIERETEIGLWLFPGLDDPDDPELVFQGNNDDYDWSKLWGEAQQLLMT